MREVPLQHCSPLSTVESETTATSFGRRAPSTVVRVQGYLVQKNPHPLRALQMYRGTSLIRSSPPPWDHHRAIGIVLL